MPAHNDSLSNAQKPRTQRCDARPPASLRESVENWRADKAAADPSAAHFTADLKAGKIKLRLSPRGYADGRDFSRDNCWRDIDGTWVIELYVSHQTPNDRELANLARDALAFYAQIRAGEIKEALRPARSDAQTPQNTPAAPTGAA